MFLHHSPYSSGRHGSNQTLQFTVDGSHLTESGDTKTLTVNTLTHDIPNGTVFNLFSGEVSSASSFTFTLTVAALKNATSIIGNLLSETIFAKK